MEFLDKRAKASGVIDNRQSIMDQVIQMIREAAASQGNGLDDIEDENWADPEPHSFPEDQPGPMPQIQMPDLSPQRPLPKPANDDLMGAIKRRMGRFF